MGGTVANVSYDGCGIGSTQTNIDIGDIIYKCVTYGETPTQNSGIVDITPLYISCDIDNDCSGGGGGGS